MRNLIFLFLLLASLSSCEDILEVNDISEAQITLLAPSDQSIITDTLVNFNWNEVADAESYRIQIAQPNFENAAQLVLDSIIRIDSSFVGTKISKTLPNSLYEWRVKAINSGYETEFSQNSFEVDASSN